MKSLYFWGSTIWPAPFQNPQTIMCCYVMPRCLLYFKEIETCWKLNGELFEHPFLGIDTSSTNYKVLIKRLLIAKMFIYSAALHFIVKCA